MTIPQNKAQATWQALTSWLETWYEFPDMEGLKVCLCSIATHYYAQERPLWLLVIGEPGSGKTEIVVQTFRTFPESRIVGSLTPKCFLSAFRAGRNDTQDHSMLTAGGPSQIWLAKDFTTFVSMRFEERAMVASSLREIYDGELISDTGVGGTKKWYGKVTLLAVATPAFERHWSAMSDLGERFMTLRWRQGNRAGAMAKARRQSGNENVIREVAQERVMELFGGAGKASSIPDDDLMRRRDCIAEVVCRLRCHVEREGYGQRDVIEVSSPEFPTRVSLALSQVVRTHMDLFHKDKADYEEFALAERLALDTIPVANRKILECIPPGETMKYNDILRKTRLPESTLKRRLEDLMLTDIIKPYNGAHWGDRTASLTVDFCELLEVSGLKFQARAQVIEMPKLLKNRGHKASFLASENM